jgi:sortase (surface protein transpeptidase)
MDASTRRSRTLRRVPALLLVLAITTGWADVGSGSSMVSDHSRREDAAWLGSSIASGFSSVIWFQERAPELVIAPVAEVKPAKVAKPKLEEVVKPAASKPATSKPAKPTYSGQNRFWIPSLGMNDRVHLFECSRQAPPDNYMYRWGCAGANNVYLMGHAYSVMKPLHDLYVRDRLKVGMVAIYANGNGKVTYYRVTEWRVVDPGDSQWAIAAQPIPSMTLQTCVGKDGRYRLTVRLVAFK